MKWNCDFMKDWVERENRKIYDRRDVWERWFAWYPVKISRGDCRWLEFVERKYVCPADPGSPLFCWWRNYRSSGKTEAV